ncbi:MAG: N-acetylglucosamine-6-phosphate deacetylase [Selenomonadaceae bacterium]|nr:N-acetylglucosamine-6-phosphate deacetylase [Selenomonadaceae bacterium]
MKTITNGKFILPDEKGNFFIAENFSVTFDEKILKISFSEKDDEIIDAENCFVAPGFINIHIHGCDGCDVMDSNSESLEKICKFLPSSGVTSFLPTTMTMKIPEIKSALENIRNNQKSFQGSKILGVNLEGPFISKKFHGSHNPENIIPPDFEIFSDFADIIKIITFAPEELEDFSFVDKCREKNIICSIGHSAADYETAKKFIEHGADHITHLFNAQTGLHHRKPGIVGAAFETNSTVELIADNVHTSPTAQRIVWKMKPHDKIILITDSFRACGLGDGESEIGGQKVFVKKNIATLDDGTIAASVAKMNEVVKKFFENTQASLTETVELVTKNPAKRLNLYNEIGSIEVGKSADFVIFDENFNIRKTIIDGKIFNNIDDRNE